MKDSKKEIAYMLAKHKTEKLKRLYVHSIIYVIFNIIIMIIKVVHNLDNGSNFKDAVLDYNTFTTPVIWGVKRNIMNSNIQPYEDPNYNSQESYEREEAYIRAKKKLEKLVGFYWHLAVYIVINIFIIIVVSNNSGEPFFSFATFATALFWGIGLFFHFVGVFGSDLMFGKKWEERKIQEMMEKDKRNWE